MILPDFQTTRGTLRMFYPIPYFCPAVSVLSVVAVLTFLYMIFRHYRVDRPFPPGCCTGCGWRFEQGDGHDCPRCGRTRRCFACGYDLTGNRSGVCPECGARMDGDRGRGGSEDRQDTAHHG